MTYSLGDKLPLELGAGANTRRRLGRGRVDPEGLLDGGQQVGQAGGGLHVDLGLALEGAPDLVDYRIVNSAVLREADVEGVPGQGRGRRLAAGRHDRGRVHEDVEVAVPGLAVARLLEHVRHKVPAAAWALALRLAGHGLLVGEAAVLALHLDVLGRAAKVLEEWPQDWVLPGDAVEAAAEDGLEDAQHPGVVLAAVEAVEAVRKGEVADDVKGQEVVPGDNVKELARGGLLGELGEQQADVLLHDGLLLVHAVGAEGVVELAPQPLVSVVVPTDQAEMVVREVEAGLLGPFGLAWPVLEDLWPGDGPIDREVVRRDAHDGSILLVQLSALAHKCSGHIDFPLVGQVCCCVELGSRIFGQGVEGQAVDNDGNSPENKQLEWSLVVSYNGTLRRECLMMG